MSNRFFRPSRLIAIGALVAVVIATLVLLPRDEADSAEPELATPLTTAEVVRTDLVEEVTFAGTVGLAEATPIAAATDGVVTGLPDANTTLGAGDRAYRIDGTDVPVVVGDAVLYRDLQLGDAPLQTTAVATGTVGDPVEVGATVTQGDVLYTFDGDPVVALYGDVALNRVLAVPDNDTTTSYASDVTSAQNRMSLLEAIDDANATLDDVRASTPSTTLLNAIDDLTTLEQNGGDATSVNRANQAVASAQQADEDRLAAAEDAIVLAQEALAEFDEREAAAARDQAAADANRYVDNPTGNDILQLETALVALGYDPDATMTVDREYDAATARAVERWQRDLGRETTGEVHPADVVFISGPTTVLEVVDDGTITSPGMGILTLSSGESLEGDDVAMIEQHLVSSGFDPGEVDGVFDEATFAAAIAWQSASEQVDDGVVHPDDVVVLEQSALVSEVHVDLGDAIRPGEPLLSLSSSERLVTVDLPAEDQSVLSVGDEVVIELPDFSETTGVVTSVATTATTLPDGSAVFEAEVELVDPSVAANLDEAPVDVTAIESEIPDALAVPVTALLALSEGGYAVEVVTGSGTALVAVDPGFFADGLVEIRSGDLAAGDLVVVP